MRLLIEYVKPEEKVAKIRITGLVPGSNVIILDDRYNIIERFENVSSEVFACCAGPFPKDIIVRSRKLGFLPFSMNVQIKSPTDKNELAVIANKDRICE